MRERLSWTEYKNGGRFLCPECGKDFGTVQGISGHVRFVHPKAFRLMKSETYIRPHAQAEQGNATERRAADEMPADAPLVRKYTSTPSPSATTVALAILNLQEVRSIGVSDLRKVMESVCAVRELDEPKNADAARALRAAESLEEMRDQRLAMAH